MSYVPRLYTPRLCLRPFVLSDAARVRELAGDARIAATTARIPHPYSLEAAEAWIRTHDDAAARGECFTFAITLAGTRTPGRELDPDDTGHVIGSIHLGLNPDPFQERAELGYWIGVPYWSKGFATEAARAVLDFGFSRRRLHKIVAHHFENNLASGRVLQKLGMVHEGVLRSHFNKDGVFHDLVLYGVLAENWQSARKSRKTPVNAQLQLA